MGASPKRHPHTRTSGRRLPTPAALALVLVLVGATSPVTRPLAADATPDPTTAAAGASRQPQASVTDPQTWSGGATASALPPPVRVAAAGTPAGGRLPADIAAVLLAAYRSAAAATPSTCHLPVSLLAAIGEVESGSLVGRPLDRQHRADILGPVLDGHGFAAVPDTDGGRWDGNTTWDRAVGPMQFLPSTWRTFGVDADGDGVADPQDVEDATAGTAAYLCYGGRDLSDPRSVRTALLSYNHSEAYLRLVLTYQQRYASLGLDDRAAATGLSSLISLAATETVASGRRSGTAAAGSLPSRTTLAHGSREEAGTRTTSGTVAAARSTGTGGRTADPTSQQPAGIATTPDASASTGTSGAAGSAGSPAAPSSNQTAASAGPTGNATSDPSPTAAGDPTSGPTGGSTGGSGGSGTGSSAGPTGGPSGNPSGGPTTGPSSGPTTGPTGGPTGGPDAACPTAPPDPNATAADSATPAGSASSSASGSATPTDSATPADSATPSQDASCAPCPKGVDPTPKAPCQPAATPAQAGSPAKDPTP